MIRRIVLENYMAHVRTVIEPARGLTVLIGPNNCGKSALIHALEMVCYNSDAADFAIRHGAKKAVVTIDTVDEDGTEHSITWWRKEKTAGYVIDGREISGMGRGKIPDDLHDHLRMPMIESAAGGKEFLLHFGLQKAPIFLVDDPPSRAAQFFASATDADKLMQMQKKHQMNTLYRKRDKEKLDGQLAQLDRQLEALTPLPAISERLTNLEDDHRRLNELGIEIRALRQAVLGVELHGIHATISARCITTLKLLEQPPGLEDTQRLGEWIGATERSLIDAARAHGFGGALGPLRPPPELPKDGPLRQACSRIEAASWRIEMQRRRAEAIEALSTPPEPHDVPAISKIIREIDSAQSKHVRWGMRSGSFAALAVPPVLDDSSQLLNLLRNLDVGRTTVRRHQARCDALKLLSAAPPLQDVEGLKRRINEIEHAGRKRDHAMKRASTVSPLAAPALPLDLQPLNDSIEKIGLAKQDESKTEEKVKRLSREIDQFRCEIEQWVKSNPRCNACGQDISAELIMDGGHRHD